LTANTADVVFIGTKTARYVSGTCPRHVCNICTHCLRRTYLAMKLCLHSRWPVILTPTMNGRHLEECVLFMSLMSMLSVLYGFKIYVYLFV